VVGGLALGQIVAWAILYYGFSSFVLPMARELGWPKATLMGAFTLGLLVMGLANYAVGAAIDQGRGRLVMTAGSVLGGVSCALWALVTQPWMLYLAMALAGAAMAMTLYEPAFNVLTKRYPTRYREGITLLTLVAGFASTLSFPACAALVGALGWRGALWVMAAVLVLGIAPLHAWLLRGPALGVSPQGHDPQDDATLHGALRTPAFWLLTLAFTLYAFASSALWAHVMPAFELAPQFQPHHVVVAPHLEARQEAVAQQHVRHLRRHHHRGTLMTSISPTRTEFSVTITTGTVPLAVLLSPRWPLRRSSRRRAASDWLSATSVAPVSTRKLTACR
jgi:MFS family permease